MLTLKNLAVAVKDWLVLQFPTEFEDGEENTNPFGAVNVDFGKFEPSLDLTVIAPAVLLYVEPANAELYPHNQRGVYRKAVFNLFACVASASGPQIAAIDAVSLAEYCEDKITTALADHLNALGSQQNNYLTEVYFRPEHPSFDAFFSNCAIAHFSFEVNYAAIFE